MTTLTSKIAVIGAGEVGSTIAYSLILTSIAGEILLVDPQEAVRDAQVQDLSDATYHGNTSTRIRAGNHKEAGQCDIVVITAGAKQKKGKVIENALCGFPYLTRILFDRVRCFTLTVHH